MSSKQDILDVMIKEHYKTVKNLEQVLIDYALEHDLRLYLDECGSGRRTLITPQVFNDWDASEDSGIGYNNKGIGEWLYSDEMC